MTSQNTGQGRVLPSVYLESLKQGNIGPKEVLTRQAPLAQGRRFGALATLPLPRPAGSDAALIHYTGCEGQGGPSDGRVRRAGGWWASECRPLWL